MSAVILDPGALVPAAWRDRLRGEAPRVFNPSVAAFRGGLLLAYRVVLADRLRRLAACRLDPRTLAPVPGSAVPLSDLVALPPLPHCSGRVRWWLADPRLAHDGDGELLVHWNSGQHPPRNAQFVQALDPDTLRPAGCARELRTEPAAPCEKNWTLFAHEGAWHAAYSVAPFRVLRLAADGPAAVEGVEVARHPWRAESYARRFGEPRGGTPPVRVGGLYYTFFHSSSGPRRHRRYRVGALAFDAEPPFAPRLWSPAPLDLPNPLGPCPPRDRLSPVVAESLFPCGAVRAEAGWIVSYGINNAHCALAVIGHAALEAGLRPVEPAGGDACRGGGWRRAVGRLLAGSP